MIHQLTPLFSVEGQKQEAIKELKRHPNKMAVVIEFEQERTGRVQYTFEIVNLSPFRVGHEWPAPVGWNGVIRAIVMPWEKDQNQVIHQVNNHYYY